MPKTKAQLDRDIAEALAGLGRKAEVYWGDRPVVVDTSTYRQTHGAEPRGRGNWTFVMGKRTYEYSDDPAIYRPAVHPAGLPFARAKALAIAKAKREGVELVGVAP
jgi:hypothetical protein